VWDQGDVKIVFFIQYLPLFLFAKFITLLPASVAIGLGRFMGRMLFKIKGKHRKITMDNVSMALDLESNEVEKLSLKIYEHLGQMFIEFLKPSSFGKEYVQAMVEAKGLEKLEKAKARGKGVLILAAHLGNWELLGSALLEHVGPITVVYKMAKNPFVTEFIRKTRKKRGIETIPHRNSARKIMGILKKGEAVGILLDQHATNKDAISADFFGMPVATNYGLALIAIKTGTPVVPAFLVKNEEGKYCCTYEEPVFLEKGEDMQADILRATTAFNGIMEKWIKNYPEQWFWVHNRFRVKKYKKKKRPK